MDCSLCWSLNFNKSRLFDQICTLGHKKLPWIGRQAPSTHSTKTSHLITLSDPSTRRVPLSFTQRLPVGDALERAVFVHCGDDST